ncbi:BspA family leucine-rich repeat surface protein, partial [Bifidobacterium bombi]
MVAREEGKGLARWSRALVGMLGTVAMLGGLFVSLPASAGEVGVDGVAPARVSDGSSSPDDTAGAGEDGDGASASGAPAAGAPAAAPAGVSGSPATGGVGDGSGLRARSISPQSGGDCSSGRQTGDGWIADNAGGGKCAVHVTGRAALQGNVASATFGALDLNKVVSVSIDNPIQLSPGDHVHLGGMSNLTSVTGLSNLRNATDLSWAFKNDSALRSLDVSGLDTSQVKDMSYMFDFDTASELSSLDVSGWDTSQVKDMSFMFNNADKLRSLDVSRWDTSQVTDMSYMFNTASELSSLDVSGWDTSHVTDMSFMFNNEDKLRSLDVSGWDTSHVTNMSYMFMWTEDLTSLDVSRWDTSHVTDMSYMFNDACKLTSLDVSHFDTRQVTDMQGMFTDASSLGSLDLSRWDTSHVTDMSWMFTDASGLTSLDLSGWDTSHVTNMGGMFAGASGLRSLRLGSHTYFDGLTGNAGSSQLVGRWTQVDPSPVPGACYVNGGDQASCSTTDPNQGLLRRPAAGGPGQVRTGAVTYARGNLVRLNYVDAQGNPLAASVVSGLGLPSSKVGSPTDRFSVALPGGSAWKFTSCSSNPTASPADSCSGASMSGVIGSSDRTLTVTMKHVTSGGGNGGSGDNGSNGSGGNNNGGSNNGGSNNGGSNNSGGNNNNGSNSNGGNAGNNGNNGGNAGNNGNNGNNGGAAGVFPGVPGRLSVLAAPGAPAPATAPAPAGGSVSPRSGVRRRGRSHTRECVAWLDAGGDGVLSDYGPNGRVVPGQVRQVSDPCADQRSAVIGGAHGVRYVTWLPYFLSGALVGGFAMEAVYLALRRRMDDGDADDGYGRADGDDG